MADESTYSTATDTTPPSSNKRKFDDQSAPPPSTRRQTGFSSPISDPAPPPSYNSVPPPVDEIQMAKQKAQEIAARIMSGAGADIKRPRAENGANMKSTISNSAPSSIPASYGSYPGGSGLSKKIDIPQGRVGVIIGKGGETIKYLQLQSGAKIQVTRDMDADPNSPYRIVELMGTPEQIAKAEQLINDVLAEADAGGSGTISRRYAGQGGSEHFSMKIANNKVGLVIGKGGDSIKNMQARSGARIQVIPLHLPPGDTSTERTVHIEGTSEQVEAAKQLVNEVTSENRMRNPNMGGGYPQQGYQARPPTSWGPSSGPPMQQAGYGYMQAGAYPSASAQYNMSQPAYPGYPPQQPSGGYPPNWDQSSVSANQQNQGYDYYSQPPTSQQQTSGGAAAPADGTGYNYSQAPASGYNQQGQAYSQDGYGGYQQPGYGQPPPYDQQQGYTSAPSYSNVANPAQEGHAPSYGAQGDSAQGSSQPSAMGQQGYSTGQQPSPNPASYPPQGAAQPGYGLPPSSQSGYGSQPAAQYGSYGAPQSQKPPANPPVYGQSQQSPTTPGSYGQPTGQPGYPHSQPLPSGYAQPDSGSQSAPPSSYGATAAQPGYAPPYGVPPAGQPGYGQGPPPYSGTSYGSGYSQPAAYSADGNATNNGRGTYESAPASQTAQQSGVAKASPQS
ncbi:far upstream element-binding protein 1-like [Populus alba x Populus x berolinensis]|nr:far upstream element-binding protein 1-like [Populus alba x Populus x berolinensis]